MPESSAKMDWYMIAFSLAAVVGLVIAGINIVDYLKYKRLIDNND